MRFVKMHGIGNDYVYVDAFRERVHDPVALARAVADRHTGVGSDGLILIAPPRDGVAADVRMRMFNADGSESEMCGNGIRCVAKFSIDRGLSTRQPLRVETGRGVLAIEWERGDDGRVRSATVDLGRPLLAASDIPVRMSGVGPADRVVERPVAIADLTPDDTRWGEACGLVPAITCVSMGNPHMILFVEDLDRVPLARVGPILEHHSWFPRRVNVHFVETLARDEARMCTWERGSGPTRACGTGAAAVCVANILTGRSERRMLLHLPGGDLTLAWLSDDSGVLKTGPATEVFEGTLSAEFLATVRSTAEARA